MTNKFWVGGTDDWDATAGLKWSATDGGIGGAAVPTSSDNVFFTLLSGVNTVTIAATATCLDLDFTGFLGTINGAFTILCSGSLTFNPLMTYAKTGDLILNSTTTGKSVTTNGLTLTSGVIQFDGVGGGWTLQDNLNTLGSLVLNNGTPDFTNRTISCATWIAQTTVTPVFTGSTINHTGNFSGAGLTYNNVIGTLNGTQIAVTGANIYSGARTYISTSYGRVTFSGNETYNAAFIATGGNDSTQRLALISSVTGTVRSPVFNDTVTLTNVDFRDITATGSSAPISGTSIGDCSRNSGITFTTPINKYWVHPATDTQSVFDANWFTASGGLIPASFPLPQDTMIFDANSFSAGSKIVNMGLVNTARLAGMDWTGATNTPTVDFSATHERYGNIILSSGMSISGTQTMTFAAGLANTITTNGKTITCPITINCPGGSLTLQDNFTSSSNLTLTAGTFDDNNFTPILSGNFASTGSLTRVLNMDSQTWELGGVNFWNVSGSGLTINPGTSAIKATNNSASTKVFAGNGLTYNNLWNATQGAGVLNVTGSNTLNDLKIDGNRTTRFTAGTTTTLNTLSRGTGAATDVITLTSVTAANHNLVKAGGGLISLDYLNVSRSQASPANTFYAGANSTDGGNNSGWIFTVPPSGPANIAALNTVAIANVASRNTIAIANIASINGI